MCLDNKGDAMFVGDQMKWITEGAHSSWNDSQLTKGFTTYASHVDTLLHVTTGANATTKMLVQTL